MKFSVPYLKTINFTFLVLLNLTPLYAMNALYNKRHCSKKNQIYNKQSLQRKNPLFDIASHILKVNNKSIMLYSYRTKKRNVIDFVKIEFSNKKDPSCLLITRFKNKRGTIFFSTLDEEKQKKITKNDQQHTK